MTSLPSAKVRSSVRWGREVCPPLPVSSTSRRSAAPVSGPSRRPTVPTSRLGSACSPKIRGDAVERAGLDRHRAPPGMTSSAGWKISRTRPGSRSATPASARPAPSSGGGVHVVAAGVRDARDGAGPRVAGAVVDRGGRRGRPAARRAARRPADVDHQPAARQRRAAPARPRRAAWRSPRWCAPRPTRARGGHAGRGVPR